MKKCKLPMIVSDAAVSITHRIVGQFEHPLADPNCKVMCRRAAWIRTGRMQQDGGVMLKTGTERVDIMNTAGPSSDVNFAEVVTVIASFLSSATIANTVSQIFFLDLLLRLLYSTTFSFLVFPFGLSPHFARASLNAA